MGVLNRIAEATGFYPASERAMLTESLNLVSSRMSAALRRDEAGWSPIGGHLDGVSEWSVSEHAHHAAVARAFATNNPLAKNGLSVRSAYIWGSGVGITATDESVNSLVQEFLDDPLNRRAFTGHLAHLEGENLLATDGNVFYICFTDAITGKVQVRPVPSSEIVETITNPEDATEVRYYRRKWAQHDTSTSVTMREALYPAIGYKPTTKPAALDGAKIHWNAPIIHGYANRPAGWAYGIGDLHASIPWARSYTGFLTDWARLTKSVSAIAYKITGKDRNDVMAARAAMHQAVTSGAPGGLLAMTGADIQSVPSTGASIDADSGQPLARMIAAGLGLPVTLLYGDPGTTGARAVAETLTKPMVLGFKNRRELWTELMRAVLNHVIDANLASARPTIGKDAERTIIFDWPEIEDTTLAETLDAVERLDATGLAPKDTLARIGLRALKVRDVDELVDSMRDAEGVFIPAGASVSDALLAAYQRGESL